MKHLVPGLAILISIVALCIAIDAHRSAQNSASDALKRREAELVAKMTPHAIEVAADLLGTNQPYASPPETIEELAAPFAGIITRMAE